MTTLREKTAFSADKLTVTVIEAVEFETDRTNRMRYVFGNLQPIAIIVKEPDRTYALDMDAQPVDIDRLNLPR